MQNLEVESTLTDKYQTTIPDPIRRALKLEKRDKIRFTLESDGSVTLARATPAVHDNASLASFLQLLATELATHPDHFRGLNPSLVKRARALTKGIKVNVEESTGSTKR